MIEIKPTTADDVIAFNGKPSDKTIRAFSVWKDGQLACIAGVTIEPDKIVAFSDVRSHNAPKLTVYRVARELMKRIKEMNLPAIAVANADLPNSQRFLASLGFTFVGDCEDGAIYQL